MRLLFVADLHYSLKQFDWLLAVAADYDTVVIGGDLLDLRSALDGDVQIAIVEKYLRLLRQKTLLVACSGNHDGDSQIQPTNRWPVGCKPPAASACTLTATDSIWATRA